MTSPPPQLKTCGSVLFVPPKIKSKEKVQPRSRSAPPSRLRESPPVENRPMSSHGDSAQQISRPAPAQVVKQAIPKQTEPERPKTHQPAPKQQQSQQPPKQPERAKTQQPQPPPKPAELEHAQESPQSSPQIRPRAQTAGVRKVDSYGTLRTETPAHLRSEPSVPQQSGHRITALQSIEPKQSQRQAVKQRVVRAQPKEEPRAAEEYGQVDIPPQPLPKAKVHILVSQRFRLSSNAATGTQGCCSFRVPSFAT